MADVWSDLLFFESRDLATRHYRQLHGHRLTAAKASEILANFAQARGYFRSARDADDLVRPLLIYYGVLALARSLILFLDPKMREASMTQSHGLRQIDWAGTLSAGAANTAARVRRLPDLRIGLCAGTFYEIATAMQNVERSYVHVGPFPSRMWLTRERPFALDQTSEVALSDLLSRVPELCDPFERAFQRSADCYFSTIFAIRLRPLGMGDGVQTDFSLYERRFTGLPDRANVVAAFAPGLDVDHLYEREESNWIKQRNLSFRITYASEQEFLDRLPPLALDQEGRQFLVAPAPEGTAFSKMLLLFMTSYIFGMLARYFPSYWLTLLNRSEGDFMRPVVQEAIGVIEDQFPRHVLNELENRIR